LVSPESSCLICRSEKSQDFCRVYDRVRGRPEETWTIKRCPDCGFGWTSPPLPHDKISSYYPPSYLGDVERTLKEFLAGKLSHSRSWRGEAEKVRLLERLVTAGSVLDVGCGDGKFLWALGRRWQRTGVDSSGETIALVTSRMPELDLIRGDFFSDGLTGRSYDAITFWHVLEHLPEPRRVMQRAVSLLKPGGWLIISLPNLDSLQARLFRRYWYGFDDVPRHLFHYSKLSLDLLLLEFDLTVRRHLLFSRLVNFHALKHSLIHWSEDKFKGRIPYYLLKPFLFAFPLLERITGRYGILTAIAQKVE